MTPSERQQSMRDRLQKGLSPLSLEIIDDSHRHVGHPGAQHGASHFSVNIVSQKFAGLSLIQCHRMVYELLRELIPDEIHALKINTSSP